MKYYFISDITGHETGSNKQTASKSCALSIVRQLYHLGVIEAFSGTLKKNRDAEQIKSYPLKISPELRNQINEILDSLEIKPINVNATNVSVSINHTCILSNQNNYSILGTRKPRLLMKEIKTIKTTILGFRCSQIEYWTNLFHQCHSQQELSVGPHLNRIGIHGQVATLTRVHYLQFHWISYPKI